MGLNEIKQFLWDIRWLGTAIHQRTRAEVYTPFVSPSEDRDMRWFAALFLLNLDLPSRSTQVDWELEFNRHQYAPWLLAQGCDLTTEKICPLFLFVKKGHRKP